ncbi:MAG: VWA domain-containing protein [Acidobacteriota bacterium]|nr:VWA domain-containing protein [Acidobacteriota bacterium]
MNELFFSDLDLLWVLGPLFLFWLLFWGWRATRRRSGAVRFSNIRILQQIKTSRTLFLRRLVMALRVITVALLIVAFVRPQTGRSHTQVRTEGIDIVLVVDTSGSMRALDLDSDRQISRRRNRLAVAKGVVEEFIERRPNDQIGLVVFGEEAFTQCPLTLDHGIVSTFLEQLEIGMAGDATAIGSALGTAVKRLKDSEAKSKVIILLTDGRNNAGVLSPAKAAEVAETFGVKVYTIGAGTRGQAPFIVDSFFGKQVVYEDVELDEESLQAIAERTGGAYFRAEDEEALQAIYGQIDELETTEITTDTYMEYNERFRWFVLPAVFLLLLEVLLLGTRFRKLP